MKTFFLFIKRQEAGSTLHSVQLWCIRLTDKTTPQTSSAQISSFLSVKKNNNKTSQCAKPRNEDCCCTYSTASPSLTLPNILTPPFHPPPLVYFINSLNSKITFTLLTPWGPRDQQMANKLVLCNHSIFFLWFSFHVCVYDLSLHRLCQSVCVFRASCWQPRSPALHQVVLL